MGIRDNLSQTFTFPNPVNEVAARSVAAGVVVMSAATVLGGFHWLVLVILYGFIARTASGPRFSPLGRLATEVIVPRLPFKAKMVAGPPKRFAQSIGLAFSLAASVSYFVIGSPFAGNLILAVLAVFALMESALGFCAGCKIFGILMKVGLVPDDVCVECANIWTRQKSHAI